MTNFVKKSQLQKRHEKGFRFKPSILSSEHNVFTKLCKIKSKRIKKWTVLQVILFSKLILHIDSLYLKRDHFVKSKVNISIEIDLIERHLNNYLSGYYDFNHKVQILSSSIKRGMKTMKTMNFLFRYCCTICYITFASYVMFVKKVRVESGLGKNFYMFQKSNFQRSARIFLIKNLYRTQCKR